MNEPDTLRYLRPAVPGTPRARKRSKVVATIGPASCSEGVLRELCFAGTNAMRINLGIGGREEHEERLALIRRISRELARPVAVIAELQGLRVRLGRLVGEADVELSPDGRIELVADLAEAGNAQRVGIGPAWVVEASRPGDELLVADGRIRLRVESAGSGSLRCVVAVGGTLRSCAGVVPPRTPADTPALTARDETDIAWAIERGVDYLALPGVRGADDVRAVNHLIQAAGAVLPVLAKIELAVAVEHFDAILEESHGVIIDRGDLGLGIAQSRLPVLQKDLIARANRAGRLVITSTQMLESMVDSPSPTRAESTDVANAIFDGSDALMLTVETAVGRYPVDAVAEALRIAVEAEASPWMPDGEEPRTLGGDPAARALANAAFRLARELEPQAILVFAHNDLKVGMLSQRRGRIPVVALCSDEALWRRLALFWGVVPLLIPFRTDAQDQLEAGIDACLEAKVLSEGDTAVVLSGISSSGGRSIKIHRV